MKLKDVIELNANLAFGPMLPPTHPPSLKNPQRVPVDDPKEKDNRFLDVTKRNDEETKKFAMRRANRSGTLGMLPYVNKVAVGPVTGGGPGSGRHKGDGDGKVPPSKKLVWTCPKCGTGMYQKDIKQGWGKDSCKECGEPRPRKG